MQFEPTPIRSLLGLAPAKQPTTGTPQPIAPATRKTTLVEAAENLLKHIPGEASGFYLMAAESFQNPALSILGLIAVLAVILLVVVRWAAGASRGVMVTTIIAFIIWMFVLDKGILHVAFPNLLPDPLGLIVAVFYSTLITILAGAGKIR